jgi:hypothetical protein
MLNNTCNTFSLLETINPRFLFYMITALQDNWIINNQTGFTYFNLGLLNMSKISKKYMGLHPIILMLYSFIFSF